jgi:hypothetical protein
MDILEPMLFIDITTSLPPSYFKWLTMLWIKSFSHLFHSSPTEQGMHTTIDKLPCFRNWNCFMPWHLKILFHFLGLKKTTACVSMLVCPHDSFHFGSASESTSLYQYSFHCDGVTGEFLSEWLEWKQIQLFPTKWCMYSKFMNF